MAEKRHKILSIVREPHTGLQYHRQVIPNHYLHNHTDISVTHATGMVSADKLAEFDAVTFLRSMSTTGETEKLSRHIREAGCKIIFDIDDYWILPKSHQQHESYTREFIPQQIEEAIRLSDMVTTTTEILADKIRPLNRNVFVLPNAIDEQQPQWQCSVKHNGLITFGWIAGIYHWDDARIIAPAFQRLIKEPFIRNRAQIYLGGFTIQQLDDGKPADMNMQYYIALERMFTDNYRLLQPDKDYIRYLMQYANILDHYGCDRPYYRGWGTDTYNYGLLYNDIDVAIAPLVDNEFSRCKSPLKIAEAGAMKKPVIASACSPYKEHVIDGYNGFLCRTPDDFYYKMRWFVKNPEMVTEMGENNYEYFKQHFDILNVSELRHEAYSSLLSKSVEV